MAVFNIKQYVVIANGNDLWYFQYGAGDKAVLKKLHSFDSPVKALAANDINVWYSGEPAKWQPEHNGQLGVALEDGTFGIYEVWETEDKQALATDVKINQLFPDPKAETPVNNNFGNIVDIIYKYGSIRDFVSFNFLKRKSSRHDMGYKFGILLAFICRRFGYCCQTSATGLIMNLQRSSMLLI